MLGAAIELAREVIGDELAFRRGICTTATLNLTWRCNLSCETCGIYRRRDPSARAEQSKELRAEAYYPAIDEMPGLGVRNVWLVGSEPLLYRGVLEVTRRLRERGLEVCLLTNGTVHREDDLRRIVELGVAEVIVSLDGPEPVHDRIRGARGAYRRSIAFVRALQAERRRKGASRPRIGCHVTISALNFRSVGEVYRECQELGVGLSMQVLSETTPREVAATRLDGAPIGADRFLPRGPSLRLTEQEGRELHRLLRELPSTSARLVEMTSPRALQEGSLPARCAQLWRGFLVIDPYGEVCPCSNLDRYSIGNITRQSLREIAGSIELARLRAELARRFFPVCTACCYRWVNLSVLERAEIAAREALLRGRRALRRA